MAGTTKIPKSAVLYIHKKDTNYKCKDCIFAKDQGNKCAIYGSSVAIKPYGTCGEWIKKKGNVEIPYIGGYTKENTGYVENPEGFTCGRCDEFLPEANDCKKVDKDSPGDDPGSILSGACCNRWEKIH
jgi:hypothetical protein